jgi:hypothetical protein
MKVKSNLKKAYFITNCFMKYVTGRGGRQRKEIKNVQLIFEAEQTQKKTRSSKNKKQKLKGKT